MNEYEIVPLRADEATMPVYECSSPELTHADHNAAIRQFQMVPINDASQYEIVTLAGEKLGSFDQSWIFSRS